MRKFKKSNILIASFMLIVGLLAGCNNNNKSEPSKNLVSIFADKGEKNCTYVQGDEFFKEYEGIGTMVPEIYACYSDGSVKLIEGEDLQNVSFVGFQENTIGVQPVVVQYNENGVKALTTYNATVVKKGTPIIDVQPKDCIGKYPEGRTFSIKVRYPEDAKYQWYTKRGTKLDPDGGEGLIETWGALDGITATTDTLIIPSTAVTQAFRKLVCDVTSISKNITVRSNIVVSYSYNTSDFIRCAYLEEYVITKGTTLDLADTPYGSGTISLDEEGLNYTFDDVHFKNDKFRAGHLTSNEGFTIANYNNQDKKITLNFKGENVFDNVLWDDKINAGGTSFNFNFLGADPVKPVITFTGPGNLEIKGGSYALHADCDIVFDLDVKFNGVKNRLTKGIVCQNFTLTENHKIEANIGGAVIFTEGVDSNVTLKEGSKIYANIYPGKVYLGATNCYGISAAGSVIINKAYIDIKFEIDTDYFAQAKQIIAPLHGIHSNHGGIEITDSTIKVSITSTNNDSIVAYEGCGIGGKYITIDNSDIDININSLAVYQSYGLYAGDQVTIRNNSNIDIDAATVGLFGGINLAQSNSTLTVSNSIIDIDSNERSMEEEDLFFNLGLKADHYVFDLRIEDYIKINTTNGLAMASKTGGKSSDTPILPVDEYVPIVLLLDALNVSFNKEVEVNLSSYCNNTKYVPVETLYLSNDLTKPVSEITITKK